MPNFRMSVPHSLPQDDAVARLKQLLGNVRREHADRIQDLQEHWNENVGTFRFSAMGFAVSGTVEVTPTEVQLSGTLPFAASLFKSKIEATIRERAAELLA